MIKRSCFQTFNVSHFQMFQMFNRSSLQTFMLSNLQTSSCSNVETFKLSNVQAFKLEREPRTTSNIPVNYCPWSEWGPRADESSNVVVLVFFRFRYGGVLLPACGREQQFGFWGFFGFSVWGRFVARVRTRARIWPAPRLAPILLY